MSRPTSSTVERHYFEQFRLDYPLPDGEVVYTDKPDVIIRGQQTVGIEITNLYIRPGADPASEQVQLRRRGQVLRRAQELYLAGGGKRFELSVDFHPAKPIMETELLARELCALASRLTTASTGRIDPVLFQHIAPLRFVYLNGAEYADAEWRLVQGYTVPNLSVERVRAVVSEKSLKRAGYQPCDRYWLLVVVDLLDRAQDQTLAWPASHSLEGSEYEKVLLYKPQYRQVVEVPQWRPSGRPSEAPSTGQARPTS